MYVAVTSSKSKTRIEHIIHKGAWTVKHAMGRTRLLESVRVESCTYSSSTCSSMNERTGTVHLQQFSATTMAPSRWVPCPFCWCSLPNAARGNPQLSTHPNQYSSAAPVLSTPTQDHPHPPQLVVEQTQNRGREPDQPVRKQAETHHHNHRLSLIHI